MSHLDHLYRTAFYLAKERDEAQDLVQETYARALDSYRRYTLGSNMKAWLTKILYNLFFDRYREKKRWIRVEDPSRDSEETPDYWETVAAGDPGPESDLLTEERNTEIAEALGKLPEEFRSPILLVDMGDLSYAEAAEILSCPVGTIRSRLSRGRKVLRRSLAGYVDVQRGKSKNEM